MNDAERDAWLREALRHAPDAGVLPPRDVSAAILAEARAAAGDRQAARSHGAPGATAHPWAAFWAWLARPPVAAGFASVMAATLVGMMWWDRPMDETLARPPAAASERAQAPAPHDAAIADTAAAKRSEPGAAATGSAAVAELPPRPNDAAGVRAEAPQPRPDAPAPGERANARDARLASPAASEKGRSADALAKEGTSRPKPKSEVPAALPLSDEQRDARSDEQRDARSDRRAPVAKKDIEAAAPPLADRGVPAGKSSLPVAPQATPAGPPAAPAAPPAAAAAPPAERMPPPEAAPRVRRQSDEGERASAANKVEPGAVKSAPTDIAAPTPATAPAPFAPPAPAAAPAPLPPPATRDGALGALGTAREKQASAFAAPPPPLQGHDATSARRESDRAMAPLASPLGAIASAPGWSRVAGGAAVALDAGRRDWLVQLDAAAAGRWRQAPASSTGDAGREGATTLRLVAPGGAPVVVRLDGTTLRVDGATAGERWQATLPAAAAERLRAAAERLPP